MKRLRREELRAHIVNSCDSTDLPYLIDATIAVVNSAEGDLTPIEQQHIADSLRKSLATIKKGKLRESLPDS